MTNETTTAANCLSRYRTDGEGKRARRLIRDALAKGYACSVNDGEETTVRTERHFQTIVDALATTDHDVVTIHRQDLNNASGWHVAGSFVLIYGNDADGSELIADHTDNFACVELADLER